MTPINANDLHRMFKKLDKNQDGKVSIDELKWLLDRIGIHTSLSELNTLIGSQTLDLVDFWIFYDILISKLDGRKEGGEVNDEEKKMEEDLIKSFKVFDMNGDGFICCEEVGSMLWRLGLWEGDCKSMIEVYDKNGDGLLDFDEFKSMMLLGTS